MLVHTLELADKRQLGRAFEALLGADGVSDCAIELDALRIRFAADERDAAAVIRELVRDGGLRAAAREWIDTGLIAASAIGSCAKVR
jgi:predicted dinucleotide-binding enzyme